MKKELWIIAIGCLLIGLIFGMAIGSYTTIKAVARVASSFVDEALVREAVYSYQNYIGTCFPSNLTI